MKVSAEAEIAAGDPFDEIQAAQQLPATRRPARGD
jgi:hypothetical protein